MGPDTSFLFNSSEHDCGFLLHSSEEAQRVVRAGAPWSDVVYGLVLADVRMERSTYPAVHLHQVSRRQGLVGDTRALSGRTRAEHVPSPAGYADVSPLNEAAT